MRRNTLLVAVATATGLMGALQADAAVVSGMHTTAGGKTVNLSGLEWLTWDQTEDMSRTEIENGTGNTFFADGWRIATRAEFEALFDSLWGGTNEAWHTSNYDGAIWMAQNLDLNSDYALGSSNSQTAHFGLAAECGGTSCYGLYGVETDKSSGWFYDSYGLGLGTDLTNSQSYFSANSKGGYISTALVRAATPVPVPAALPMFLAGLGAFGFMRRRR